MLHFILFIFFFPQLLKNILLWSNLLSIDTLKHITLTCLINRYLLVGLACLLSVVTLKSNDDKSNLIMNSSFPTSLSLIDQSGSLAFRDAVQKLKMIVDLLPHEWLKLSSPSIKQDDDDRGHDDDDNDDDESSRKVSFTGVSDPLNQIKRFLTQLLENIPPTRMYSDITVGQVDIQIIERYVKESLSFLKKFFI